MGDSGYGNQDNHPGALDVDVDWILGGGKSGNKIRPDKNLRQKVSLDRTPLCSTGSQLSSNAYIFEGKKLIDMLTRFHLKFSVRNVELDDESNDSMSPTCLESPSNIAND